jgi:hypothetical protein
MAEDVAGNSMPQDILNTFYFDENPLCAMQNLFEDEEGGRKKIIIVSNQRLMYFEENATGMYDNVLYAFARIDSVVFHEGKKTANMKIIDTDGTALKIDWLLNEEAEQIFLTLQSAMNDLGTVFVPLSRKKSMFSLKKWTLKKPMDYLTKTIKLDAYPMTETYIVPIIPKDGKNKDKVEEIHEPFERGDESITELVSTATEKTMNQDTVKECLRALRTLYDNQVLTEEQYRKLRLSLLERLDI